MKIITVNVSDDEIKEIAADNDIPENEWPFAVERVLTARTIIESVATRHVRDIVEKVVLGVKL